VWENTSTRADVLNPMTTRAFGLVGAICVATLVAACDVKVGQNGVSVDVVHGKAADEWKRSYRLAPGGHLDIVNVSGLISASRGEGLDIEVVATREARATTDEAAKAILDKAEMVEQTSPDRVSIESRVARRGGGRLTVQFTVRVPPGLNVSLKNQDGGVRLTGVQGTIAAESVNGAVIGRELAGAVTASTVNGPVRIELTSISGDSRFTTVNGPVELALAPTLNASLEASVINGSIMVAAGFPLEAAERAQQRVVGRINQGGPRIVAQTTNGPVRVRTGVLDEDERRGRNSGRGGSSP
jgi:Putative adhesin